MTKDEALRLALEVLADLGMKHYENTGEVLYKNTYTAIKAALEAKDEPVAWMNDSTPSGIFARHIEGAKNFGCTIPLYTTPPQPVIDESAAKRIATALGWEPKRKPLTDEKIWACLPKEPDEMEFARAIEAAHGIKGEA